jgi:hypothetical protein
MTDKGGMQTLSGTLWPRISNVLSTQFVKGAGKMVRYRRHNAAGVADAPPRASTPRNDVMGRKSIKARGNTIAKPTAKKSAPLRTAPGSARPHSSDQPGGKRTANTSARSHWGVTGNVRTRENPLRRGSAAPSRSCRS